MKVAQFVGVVVVGVIRHFLIPSSQFDKWQSIPDWIIYTHTNTPTSQIFNGGWTTGVHAMALKPFRFTSYTTTTKMLKFSIYDQIFFDFLLGPKVKIVLTPTYI